MLPNNDSSITTVIKSTTVQRDTTGSTKKKIKHDSSPKVDMAEKEYTTYLQTNLKNNVDFPKEQSITETIGKSMLGRMAPQPLYSCDHDAIPLLKGYVTDRCPL